MSKKISELTSATTPLAGTETVEIVQGGASKKVAVSYLAASYGGREVLSAARTYYVRSDGSDSNDGLANTSGGAFLTIQKAVNVTCALDMSIYAVTIQCGDATRTESVTLKRYLGTEAPTIIGNITTPSNCLMSVTSNNCFTNEALVEWKIQGFKMTVATSGYCIATSGGGSRVSFSNVDFGSAPNQHITATLASVIYATGSYSITGACQFHAAATENATTSIGGVTITITGTPNFSTGFLYGRKGHFLVQNITFSGSATGPRFLVDLCSTIFSNGASEASYLPGNSAGTKANGSAWS